MDAERQTRVAENESLFRLVNERIEDGHERFGTTGAQEYYCECGDAGCADRVRLTRDDYDRVRSNPRRFAIVPGHDVPEAEDVVETHGEYAVVEKIGLGGQVAEERDPRT